MSDNDLSLQQRKQALPLFLLLIAAGLAGNYFKFPIFLNIDFLFGSIFAMLVLQFCGLGRGILAGAVIAGYTWFLWNHPYALIVMTAEVAVVGWLIARHKMGLVLADTLYWLIIGMPLLYLFFHFVMQVPASNTYIIMTKNAVNGIANALVARLIFTGFALRSRSSLISYSEIVYNLLAFFVLCPALLMLAVESRTDIKVTDRHIRYTLDNGSQRMGHYVQTWVLNRKSAIINLAEMAATRSPQQMQPYLEHTKMSDINFPRVGLLDKTATITAYAPLLDEFGVSNIGKSAADRPYIPQLKQTLKPMLSEVVLGIIGAPKPRVFLLVPVVVRGEYGGYIVGVLNLEQIREQFEKSLADDATLYTLLDKNGNVIMTNRTDQKVMTPFVRSKGTLNSLGKKISQWVPTLPPNTPPTEQWQKSFYVAETTIGDLAEWKLILELPVAPFQKTLYDNYTGKLTLLFLILLGALALAELLSRKTVATLGQLRTLTHALPVRLATNGKDIVWPESGIKEANHLINNFRVMADSLSELFIETRQINESLEKRVEERTIELAKIMQELNIILENAPFGISKMIDRKQVWVNRKTEDMLKYPKAELELQTTRVLYPSDAAYTQFGLEAYPLLAQGQVFETVQEWIRKDGVHILVRGIGKAVEPPDMSKGTIWMLEDITDRRQVEADKEKMEAQNRQLQKAESLGRMAGAIAHTFNNQLGVVIGNLELALMDQAKVAGPVLHSLTAAMKASQKAAEVSGQMLTYLGQSFDKREQLDMAEICRRHLPMLQASVPGKVVLETALPSPGPTVLVNGNDIQQALTNLITNAWEAVGVDRGIIHLGVKTVSPADIPTSHCYPVDWQPQGNAYACMEVADRGCGVADEDIEKLFDPFFTTKFTGRGLGLAVVLGIAKAHAGAVTVESTPGRGSTFRLFFPVSAAELPRQKEQAVQPVLGVPTPESGNHTAATAESGTILLVEDEEMLRDMAAAMLTRLGFNVLAAKDGVEAVEIFRQRQGEIRLVLSDLTMPRLNGWETLTALRQLAPDLPVILASGYDRAQVMAGDHPELPQVFLGKPYKLQELRDAIGQALVK